MIRAAITFFVIGLIAMLLGANNIAGVSMEVGRMILFVFLALAVVSLIVGVVAGRGVTRRGGGMFALLLAAMLAGYFAKPVVSLASENLGEKIENKAGDVKTDAKKSSRKAKRHARKAHGNDNVLKDARDSANDAGDDISNTAKKTKNKID